MPGSALEGGAIFESEGQAAIRVGRGVVQQAAPKLLAEGSALNVGPDLCPFQSAAAFYLMSCHESAGT